MKRFIRVVDGFIEIPVPFASARVSAARDQTTAR